jgi:hypothetical protein
LLWRHRGVLSPPVVLGIGVILFFLIEAALGWPSTLTTIFGGTALDGVRFYGLPNVFEGLLYGSGLYIAASRKSLQGVALLFALGMFAGFPGLGADLGGALSCFAAAGLWLALAERGSRNTKMVWRLAQGALVALAGLIVVLVANRFAPTATHITAFTESGGGGILHTIASRLGVGWDLLMRNPFGFIPVLGILILLVVVLKPPAAIRESFAAFPAWRTAMLVLVLTSVVAYFANDTGVAASGQGFAMALAGLLYVPLALIPRKMDT